MESKLPHVGTTIFSVMSKLAVETGAINLSQGFPDFPIDGKLIELVDKALIAGHNQYAPMPGLPKLLDALADKVERLYKTKYDPASEITITAGGTQAIFTAIAATVHPGDEVIIVDPAYDCYAPTVTLFGGTAVHVRLGDDMKFNADAVQAAITPRTRMLMINTPHNPAGTILRDADMKRVVEMLRGNNIILLSDEVYEHLVFDGEPHASAINYPELHERAFVIFSFGKVFHTTGWKMGYVLAPNELMAEFRKVHQFNVFSVNTPIQHALAEYLKDPAHYEQVPSFYQAKRDRFLTGLQRTKFKPLSCEGSYFQVADYSAISDLPDVEFAKWLAREKGVAGIPLSPFYKDPPTGQRLIRFCFAKQGATLDAAIEKAMRDLNVTLVQSMLHWEDAEANRNMFAEKLAALMQPTDLIVLPEMFTTGFTMNTALAETMDGPTVQWMKEQSTLRNVALFGSVIIEEGEAVFNRGLYVDAKGVVTCYDKRHLFRFANENEHFTAGKNRVIIELAGWSILLQICFDLRFPVFSRNRQDGLKSDYDAVLYVANWPEARSYPWSQLLIARAIENQCYVIGVNRVGMDGKGIHYSGNSAMIDPRGEVENCTPGKEECRTVTLQWGVLEDFRTKFPFGLDADGFELDL